MRRRGGPPGPAGGGEAILMVVSGTLYCWIVFSLFSYYVIGYSVLGSIVASFPVALVCGLTMLPAFVVFVLSILAFIVWLLVTYFQWAATLAVVL